MAATPGRGTPSIDPYAAHQAARKAKRLWPNVIGEVLADDIMAVLDLPPWLQAHTRTWRLIDEILGIAEPDKKKVRQAA